MSNRQRKAMKVGKSRKNTEEPPEVNAAFPLILFATLPLAVAATGAAFLAILACAG